MTQLYLAIGSNLIALIIALLIVSLCKYKAYLIVNERLEIYLNKYVWVGNLKSSNEPVLMKIDSHILAIHKTLMHVGRLSEFVFGTSKEVVKNECNLIRFIEDR
ncbi:MAG: hypothetical protein COA63_013995 [Methylophaga sp.]|nr:hypothetical protein [Methylophaga sp.]